MSTSKKKIIPKNGAAIKKQALIHKLLKKSPNLSTPIAKESQYAWINFYNEIINLQKKNDLQIALAKALDLNKRFPGIQDIQNVAAVLLMQNHQHNEAISLWQSITNQESNVNVQTNLGRAHQLLKQFEQAVFHLDRALTLSPQHQDALLNMGVVMGHLNRWPESITYYERLLELVPQHLQALFNLATAHQHNLNFSKAYYLYEKILDIDPSHKDALSNLIFTQHYQVPHRPELIANRAKRLGQIFCQQHSVKYATMEPPSPHKTLTIGLVSADLRNHPVGYFIEGLLASQAAQDLIWCAYANSPITDELTQRIRPVFKNWYTIDTWSDDRVLQQIRNDEIDVLIDLSGLTAGNRLGIFAAQAATLQVTWLGYFGTTGLPTMHAILADPHCVPPEESSWLIEKVWRLPHTRLCFTPPDVAIPITPLPALRNGYLTFGCFQSLPKINDKVIQTWGEIAKLKPDIRWHFQNNRLNENSIDLEHFKYKLLQVGFIEKNLSFSGATSRVEYLKKHHEIDLGKVCKSQSCDGKM